MLQRGEDLDKLVEKSGSLSQQSKMFYKSAKKVRSPLTSKVRYRMLTRLVLWCHLSTHLFSTDWYLADACIPNAQQPVRSEPAPHAAAPP